MALKYVGSNNPASRNFGFDLGTFQNISEPQFPHLKVGIITYSTSKNDI